MVIDFGSFYDFPRLINSLLAEMDRPSSALGFRANFPPLNISESEDAVRIKALIPGADINDVELTLTDNSLCLKGELQPKQGNYHRQERPTGPFTRVVNINVPIETENVKAVMKDGVLTITLPKCTACKPRTIHIQTR